MRARDWVQTIGLSAINWIASVSCFVAAILAVGSNVPWTRVILVYCAGATASSFNLTPGGLGVTEAVLTAGLVASGMRPAAALGSAVDLSTGQLLAGCAGGLDYLFRSPSRFGAAWGRHGS